MYLDLVRIVYKYVNPMTSLIAYVQFITAYMAVPKGEKGGAISAAVWQGMDCNMQQC